MRINHSAARNLPALPAPESLPIQPDERVLFLADLSMYGDEQDKFLGSSAQGRLVCALTTESLFIRTPYAIWSFDLAGDVASITCQRGGLFSKGWFDVELVRTETFPFDNGETGQLSGLHLYFKKKRDLALLGDLLAQIVQ